MKTNWWKWGSIGVILAVLFFLGWKCGRDSVKPSTAVTIRDTIPGAIEVVVDTFYVPKPYKVVIMSQTPTDTIAQITDIVGRSFIDSSGIYYRDAPVDSFHTAWRRKIIFPGDSSKVDTSKVFRFDDPYNPPMDWEGSGIAYYSDTVKVSNGTVTINDTLNGNRITGRSVQANLTIPIVRETVLQPKHSIVYFGLQVQGGPQNYLYSLGADLSLKAKNDRIYSAGVGLTRDNQVLYGVGVRWPIRFKR